jgi:hypothetical protein
VLRSELHSAWPTVIVMALNRRLPHRYLAAPRVHLGPHAEIDVTAYEPDAPDSADTKCAALLQQHVSVALVELVTTRRFNLCVDLFESRIMHAGEDDVSPLRAFPSPVEMKSRSAPCELDLQVSIAMRPHGDESLAPVTRFGYFEGHQRRCGEWTLRP